MFLASAVLRHMMMEKYLAKLDILMFFDGFSLVTDIEEKTNMLRDGICKIEN